MKVSFFETGRYVSPPGTPREWPVPSGAYDPELGAKAYSTMIDRIRLVEELGFDWVSLSEHHYSPRILTPSPPLSAAWVAAQVKRIKIALWGRSYRRAIRCASPRSSGCSTRWPAAVSSSASCAARPTST
jgi:hypothetical protein